MLIHTISQNPTNAPGQMATKFGFVTETTYKFLPPSPIYTYKPVPRSHVDMLCKNMHTCLQKALGEILLLFFAESVKDEPADKYIESLSADDAATIAQHARLLFPRLALEHVVLRSDLHSGYSSSKHDPGNDLARRYPAANAGGHALRTSFHDPLTPTAGQKPPALARTGQFRA